jgi:hypothetical protein
MIGINLGGDPAYAPGAPDPAMLHGLGFRFGLFVSKPGREPYVAACSAANLMPVGIVTEESGGFILQTPWTLIGNEANTSGNADAMSARAYAGYLQNYRANIPPERSLVVGGLMATGSATYLRDVRDAGGLEGYSAVALHYPTSAKQIANWRTYAAGLDVWVTEYAPQSDRGMWDLSLIPFYLNEILRAGGVMVHAPYCWTNAMVDPFGISDDPRILQTILAST